MSSTSEAITRGLRVRVTARFIEQDSSPEDLRWLFGYLVCIINEGEKATQLVSRHWEITDSHGAVQTVRGPGVIGEQPRLEPGESFTYTSACPLTTPVGSMHGSFSMRDDNGESWDATVAPFTLSTPFALN